MVWSVEPWEALEVGWGSRLPEDRRGRAVLGMDLQSSPPAAQNTGGHLDQWGRVQRAGLDAGHHTRESRMLVVAGNSHHRVGPWIHRSPEDNLSGTFYLLQENIVY